ncbi:hypothetical protein VP01_3143g1 [Puccinia sorghi]|uniref:Uncharacterized protein n=1 Tax=Puccinia sorghi TaxID=27349 RepID=A0A0L6UYW7_9BASI|nr:hypothetical protein VP01_3143g1 [Puccinia sorghi]
MSPGMLINTHPSLALYLLHPMFCYGGWGLLWLHVQGYTPPQHERSPHGVVESNRIPGRLALRLKYSWIREAGSVPYFHSHTASSPGESLPEGGLNTPKLGRGVKQSFFWVIYAAPHHMNCSLMDELLKPFSSGDPVSPAVYVMNCADDRRAHANYLPHMIIMDVCVVALLMAGIGGVSGLVRSVLISPEFCEDCQGTIDSPTKRHSGMELVKTRRRCREVIQDPAGRWHACPGVETGYFGSLPQMILPLLLILPLPLAVHTLLSLCAPNNHSNVAQVCSKLFSWLGVGAFDVHFFTNSRALASLVSVPGGSIALCIFTVVSHLVSRWKLASVCRCSRNLLSSGVQSSHKPEDCRHGLIETNIHWIGRVSTKKSERSDIPGLNWGNSAYGSVGWRKTCAKLTNACRLHVCLPAIPILYPSSQRCVPSFSVSLSLFYSLFFFCPSLNTSSARGTPTAIIQGSTFFQSLP